MTVSPLYEARLENVKLVTEMRELRERIRPQSAAEIARVKKALRESRYRSAAHRARVVELENAIADWLVGDLNENQLAAKLGQKAARIAA